MTKKKNNDCKKNNSIQCDVSSCKHNNCEEGYCELDEIKVSCTCDNDNCSCTDKTICDSFEEHGEDDANNQEESNLTDTEYEVTAEDEDIVEE